MTSPVVTKGSAGGAPQVRATLSRLRQRSSHDRRSVGRWRGWWFVAPAGVFYALFVLRPLASTIQYSFYDWNGIGTATPVGLDNYLKVLSDASLRSAIGHSFLLIFFFTVLPLIGGLLVAALLRDLRSRGFGTVARTILFLPQILPGAAAAVAWAWMYSPDGTVNQVLRVVGLDSVARAWLGDMTWALPAVGLIGTWINLGFCMILLMAGIGRIDPSIYEAATLDGAGFWRTLTAVTLPGLRGEIGICITMTMISALSSFDVVFMSTQGGPGYATMVPGVLIYQLGFTQSRVGLASALAIVLTLLIFIVVLPLQRIFRAEEPS